MQLFQSDQITKPDQQTFAYLEVKEYDHVLSITLDREAKRNAIHPQMVNELAFCMQYAHHESSVWVILIQAKGKVFCAGADLKAFAGLIEPDDSTIPKLEGSVLIGELFNKVHKPIVAKITGDVYAGGFFFLAGSHIVLSQDNVKFGLPEVKRGLYPFQVMQALLQVMPPRKVIDWCIRGYNLPVDEAARYGLVTELCSAETIDERSDQVIEELKQNSPTAIHLGLQAYDHIQPSEAAHQYLYEMLQKPFSRKMVRKA